VLLNEEFKLARLVSNVGIRARIVSEKFGHLSVAFTLDTYSHVIGGWTKCWS